MSNIITEALNNLVAASHRRNGVFEALKEISIESWKVAERRLSKPEFLALIDDFRLYNAGLITIGEVEESMILRACEAQEVKLRLVGYQRIFVR